MASMRVLRAIVVVGVVVATAGGLLGSAGATKPPLVSDSVRAWNAHALAALANPGTAPVPGAGQTPPVSAVHMAMVQLAVYDAVNAIDGGHEPYLDGLAPAPSSASLDAAVATAAHHVLVGLGRPPVPALPQVVMDRLDDLHTDALAVIPDGPAKNQGTAIGAAAAEALLAERDGDGRYVPVAFAEGTEPGEWRRTGAISDPFAWMAKVRPFTLESTSQFRSKGPRELTSRAYAKEYNEVKELGLLGASRSPEQLALAQFYLNTVSPIELFNRAFRGLTEAQGLGVVDEARFFATLNVTAADSLINCWDDKAHWGFWRPVTAIQHGDGDDNPRTVGDPAWASFLAAPPYPEHPSGYNCATAGSMYAAQAFFGRGKMEFTVHSLVTDVKRTYDRFTNVVNDTIDARVYQGIHFRTGDEQGALIGKEVARWVDKHFFRRAK